MDANTRTDLYFRRTKDDTWVVCGPASSVKLGENIITKKDGTNRTVWVTRLGKPFFDNKAKKELRYGHIGPKLETFLAVPLVNIPAYIPLAVARTRAARQYEKDRGPAKYAAWKKHLATILDEQLPNPAEFDGDVRIQVVVITADYNARDWKANKLAENKAMSTVDEIAGRYELDGKPEISVSTRPLVERAEGVEIPEGTNFVVLFKREART